MSMVAVFLLVIGFMNLIAPKFGWFMSIGWKLKDAEPSDAYLMMSRIGGGIALVIAIGMFIHGA